MDSDIVVKVESVSKDFKLPSENSKSVKSIFTNFSSFRHKSYKTQHALKDINFEVRKGEFFGIVGRNGSGKSTLLKLIAGIYQPTEGSISTVGRLVPFIELGVGFNPELSGRDNVYLNGAMLGFDNNAIDTKYTKIVEFAELEKFMNQKLRNYSSGMQVRLAFSVATILAESDILLLDEVLAVGDADFQRKCFDYFRQLKKMKKTVIFISHDMDAIREYCDRAIIIDEAKVIKSGTPEEVSKTYTKLFLEEAGDNKLDNSNDDESRWGNGHAMISEPKAAISDEIIKITHIVKNIHEVKSPAVGIRFKSLTGEVVMGTSTKIKKLTLDEKKESLYNIEWSFPNILSDGVFEIDIAVTENSGLSTCDWWDNALTIRIRKAEKVPYNINPNIKVKKYVEKTI